MAQKYYNTAETAKLLGKSVEEVKKMLENRELHGYRDGADWKFKTEEIEQLAKEIGAAKTHTDERGGDVLLSEVELGHSDPGLSGTVIGLSAGGQVVADSDIRLAGSDLQLGEESKTKLGVKAPPGDSKKFEELDLALEKDLTLEDSAVALDAKGEGSSAIDLGGKTRDDDELVLGGSGTGSDVTLGGDSGIMLVDPSDSGFSLETPVNLGPAAEESLELGEDDMLTEAKAPGLKTDEEFLLTPLEEAADVEESESGSQVIALDVGGDEGATMIGSSAGVSMAAMLDEDLSGQPALDLGMGSPLAAAPALGAQPGALAEGAPLTYPAAALAEAPYTGWQIAGLAVCLLLLLLCGMMMYDLLRSMWSWEQPTAINSALMDTILGWIEGK